MNKLLNKAIRPLAALTIVGALAAVAAFALLAMPGSQPAEAAQQVGATSNDPSAVAVTATRDSVTLAVTNADLETNDFLFLEIPGYRALDTRTWDDPNDSPDLGDIIDPQRGCTVAVTVAGTNRISDAGDITNGGFGCKTNDDNDGIVAYTTTVSTPPGDNVETYTVVVTDVAPISAAPSMQTLTLRENAAADVNVINYETFMPGTAGTPVEIGYDIAATPTPETGISFRASGNASDTVDINSTTSSAAIQIQATIQELPMDLESGSSIVLYLEDDYVVPGSIATNHVWFTIAGLPNVGTTEANKGRHYPSDPIEIDTDDYYAGDDDTYIQVFLPDLYPGDVVGTSEGFQHPLAGETVNLTIHKNAGVKNPPEAGSHSVGYSVLGPDDADVPNPQSPLKTNRGLDPQTFAKISLSDDDDARGKVVTVTGSGFNNGVSASLYMKHYASVEESDGTVTHHSGRYTDPAEGETDPTLSQSGDPNAAIASAAAVAANRLEFLRNGGSAADFTLAVGDVMTVAQTCTDIVANGIQLGSGNNVVGSDDRVEIEFTVANPPFRPGNKNLLCMVDGERTASSDDVEHFKLDPSIRVVPNTVNAGDQVTVFAEDYPAGDAFQWLEVLGERVTGASGTTISASGKGSATFDMPGNRKGIIKVEACWGESDSNCDKESANITVSPSQLSASKLEVRANESIIIRGSGFSEDSGDGNDLATAKIGEADLVLASDGGNLMDVEVSNSGQFSATFAVWSAADNNPALEPGEHKIVVTDVDGFSGEVEITIVEPTVSITPNVAGPRDYVVISGANWPVENDDGGNVEDVTINVSGAGIDEDNMNESADANGNWSVRYRVPGDVSIPGTLNVKATYGESEDIVKIENFSVPQANLEVSPATVVPGGDLTLSASGFTLYESNIEVKIGNLDVAVPTGTSTDREGALDGLTVKVPSLDPATYTVQLKVGGGDNTTVAIGEVVVLDDDTGGESPLPGALSPLGDNLVRVFHFNNANKTWSFYDPRPEFAELNTLSALTSGQSYWILVGANQDATLNANAYTLTCLNGECWNSIVW